MNFIHLFVGGYLDCFHLSAILNNTTLSMDVHIFISLNPILNYFGYMPKSGITSMYDNSLFNF